MGERSAFEALSPPMRQASSSSMAQANTPRTAITSPMLSVCEASFVNASLSVNEPVETIISAAARRLGEWGKGGNVNKRGIGSCE